MVTIWISWNLQFASFERHILRLLQLIKANCPSFTSTPIHFCLISSFFTRLLDFYCSLSKFTCICCPSILCTATTNSCFYICAFFSADSHVSGLLTQVDGVSLQGCSEQRATEMLRRTGPVVTLKLLRRAVRLSHVLPSLPPLQPLRHSHSFHEGSHYRGGLNKIQETGTKRGEHIESIVSDRRNVLFFLVTQ